MKVFWGFGRTRSRINKGLLKRHINNYVNCIHRAVGHARENMEVLVLEADVNMETNEHFFIKQGTKKGYIEVPQGGVQDGRKNSPTITAGREEPCYFEGVEAKVKQVGNLIDDSGRKFKNPQTGRVYDVDGLSPTVNTCQGGGREPKIITSYRIRKLTPRECFRLMGVSESDIDKIQQSGVSQSQQYKMAGNSIVVDVLENIFRKMFVEIGQESQQLSLF